MLNRGESMWTMSWSERKDMNGQVESVVRSAVDKGERDSKSCWWKGSKNSEFLSALATSLDPYCRHVDNSAGNWTQTTLKTTSLAKIDVVYVN